jgi:hypothetical protein
MGRRADAAVPEEKRIGVAYLESREKSSLLSKTTRGALDTLATNAAVAIEAPVFISQERCSQRTA